MCFAFILDNIKKYNADVLRLEYRAVKEESGFRKTNYVFSISSENDFGQGLSACLYVVERKLLIENNIIFDCDLSYGEDYLWALLLRIFSKKCIKTDDLIYNYRQVKNSAMNNFSKSSAEQHIKSMTLLAQKYFSITKSFELNQAEIDRIISRKDLAIQSALFTAIRVGYTYEELQFLLKELKQKRLYPYNIIWKHLWPNTSFTHSIINWFTLLFPIEKIYYLTAYLIRSIQEFRGK